MIHRCFFALCLTLLSTPALSQSIDDWLINGQTAVAGHRYDEAETWFSRVVEADADHAEAHYGLAQVYFAQDNPKQADRSIGKALKVDAESVSYLEMKLRIGYPREPLKIARESRLQELAKKILKLDPTNATAHSSIGFDKADRYYLHRTLIQATCVSPPLLQKGPVATRREPTSGGSSSCYVDGEIMKRIKDRFNIAHLKDMGVNIVDRNQAAGPAYEIATHHLEAARQSAPDRFNVAERLSQLYVLEGALEQAINVALDMKDVFPESPRALLWAGFSFFRMGDVDEAAYYFAEAQRLMPDSMLTSFQDLSRILSEDEQVRYQEDPVSFANQYWTLHDPRLLNESQERKLEHDARMAYADLLFSGYEEVAYGWDTEPGRIYVRYGEPLQEYTLIDSEATTLDIPDPNLSHGSKFYFKIWEYGDFRFVFSDMHRQDDRVEYHIWSPRHDIVQWNPEYDYVIFERELAKELPQRHIHASPANRVDFPFQVSVFQGETQQADVVVSYGIPHVPEQGAMIPNLRTGAFLIDPQGAVLDEAQRTMAVGDFDILYRTGQGLLGLDLYQLEAPPGLFEVAIEFEELHEEGVIGYNRSNVETADFTKQTLKASDIMLAYRAEEVEPDETLQRGEMVRHGIALTPAPTTTIAREEPLSLYFELYNLQQDPQQQTRYQVEVALAEQQDGKKRLFRRKRSTEVAIQYEGTGTSSTDGLYFLLDTSEQKPGAYHLILRVKDTLTGDQIERRRTLVLK